MALAGAPFERLTPQETQALFPAMTVDDLAFSLYEPDASVIRATAAVEALLRRARRGGARLLVDRALPSGPGAVSLAGGVRAADRVVWACGAWLGTLFPREAPVRATWQDVLHWNTPPAWRGGPAWFDERVDLYGFPDVDGLGVKAVTHRPGRTFDLDRDARVPEPATIAEVAGYLARRFPALAGAGLLWARVMPYEMTPDGNFIAGPAELDGHWLLGGGSGHGFKHAPALGEHVADLLEGRAEVVPMLRPGPRAERRSPSGTVPGAG
jgi:glycine/D-amino acid oxidase-like deaminating enzyme